MLLHSAITEERTLLTIHLLEELRITSAWTMRIKYTEGEKNEVSDDLWKNNDLRKGQRNCL